MSARLGPKAIAVPENTFDVRFHDLGEVNIRCA
jgi:hypothetical protein